MDVANVGKLTTILSSSQQSEQQNTKIAEQCRNMTQYVKAHQSKDNENWQRDGVTIQDPEDNKRNSSATDSWSMEVEQEEGGSRIEIPGDTLTPTSSQDAGLSKLTKNANNVLIHIEQEETRRVSLLFDITIRISLLLGSYRNDTYFKFT